MTSFRRLAIVLLAIVPTTLLAQTKDLGQATQYYKQPTPKFGFVPGPKPGGGEVHMTTGAGGHVVTEKDEYSILEGDVLI